MEPNTLTEGKYIIFVGGRVDMFSADKIHSFRACSCPEKDCAGRAVSAGRFVVRPDGTVDAGGESTTLGVKSRPEDSKLLQEALTNQD